MSSAALRSWVLVLSALTLAPPPGAGAADSGSARSWFADQLAYLGAAHEAAEPQRLAELWARAADGSRSLADRRSSFESLLERWIELHGAADQYPDGPPATLIDRVDEITGMPAPEPVLPDGGGDPLRSAVATGAGGPVAILIEGAATGALEPLAEILAADHRVLRVGLPGLDGAQPLARPALRTYSQRAWTTAVEGALGARVETEDWREVVLIGHDLGAALAAELATRIGDRLEAVVLIDPANPTMPFAEHDQRVAAVESSLLPLLPSPDLEARLASGAMLNGAYAFDPTVSERLARARAEVDPRVLGRWRSEASTLDRAAVVGAFEVPTWLFLSLADESSVLVATPLLAGQLWGRAAIAHPETPFAIVPFDDVRSAPVDAPLAVARAIEDAVAGRAPLGTPHDPARIGNPASRSTFLRAGVGFTEVAVDYYAPSRAGRELWGALVPWDQVWRAGANDATRVTFSRDVELGGERLSAGTYSFFVIPREDRPWTAIVHSVPWAYGAFGYDERYDALRLEVSPRAAARHHELLEYRVDARSTGRAELVLAWGDVELALPLVADHGLQLIDAVPTARLSGLGPWTQLATDIEGDAMNQPVLHDGVSLDATFECATDLVWFRFGLAAPPSERSIGLNVAVDTDLDQATGMAWWVQGSAFTFDRLITLWVDGADRRFGGTVGGAEHDEVGAGRFTTTFEGELELGVDARANRLFFGVPARRLDDDGRMAIAATVGTHLFWNDDLIDGGGVTFDVGELRRSACAGL